MRSLTLKLALAFLVVSIIGVALAAGFARWIMLAEFGSLVLDQAQDDFIADVLTYYQMNGSWVGVAQSLPAVNPARAPQPLPGNREHPEGLPPPPQQLPPEGAGHPGGQAPTFSFVLVDSGGTVVVPAGPYHLGDFLSPDELAGGVEITIDEQVVGSVLTAGTPPELTPREELFLERINQALLYAALGATSLALFLSLFLARTLTRPLHELIAATRAMARGDLKQQVAVRSQDELGELAAAFNQMSVRLARANELRRQMTADIAHDLRTPLTVIKGYTEALRDGDLPPATATFETIYQEAEQLNHLIDDLRTLSLVDAGELTLHRQATAPQDLLERAAAAYLPQARQLGITLHVDAVPDLPSVQVDPERLAQVIGNLVSNGLRYTPEGGRITLAARQRADGVYLIIQDTGAGIAPADLPHIFDRFYRGDAARETNEGESGLGLAIAKSLVEAHGGALSASSTLGEGSTFVIALPQTGSR